MQIIAVMSKKQLTQIKKNVHTQKNNHRNPFAALWPFFVLAFICIFHCSNHRVFFDRGPGSDDDEP